MKFLPPEAYQPTANLLFDQIADQLRAVLPDAQVEHVGSSSIPDTVSKGDLDIYVGVAPDDFDAAITRIESLGFSIKHNSQRTHELCPFESEDYALDVGVQLVARGSEFEFFLVFRDMLVADPRLREAYNQMKLGAAHLGPDAYRRVKSDFIEPLVGRRRDT